MIYRIGLFWAIIRAMRSMTGFGRGEAAAQGWQITAEVSGVNRKQIDISLNLPSGLSELDSSLRKLISSFISRGRVNAKIVLTHTESGDNQLFFDEVLATQYVDAARKIADETGIEPTITAADLFRAPGVFRVEESGLNPGDVRDAIESALRSALENLIEMQEDEGDHLQEDLNQRLKIIESEIDEVKERSPGVVEMYRKNLFSRLKDSGLELDLDDERILREIGVFAERCDVSEELTRIDSHVGQFRKYFAQAESIGRSLDFLCQELNREINTIGSKANDAEIAQRIVNSKTELEKIREQVQNVQ